MSLEYELMKRREESRRHTEAIRKVYSDIEIPEGIKRKVREWSFEVEHPKY